MARMKGKYALVTGGSSGIGLETARQFLAEGAHVAITGRDADALARAQAQLGEAVRVIRSDASQVDDQQLIAETLRQAWPRLDVLYANAADVTHRLLQEWDEVTFDRVLATNLKGPFFLVQSLLPLLGDPASIILCGSTSAHIGLPQSSVYAASKAALLSLARTLSAELHPRGVRVNVLSPGPTDTPALNKLGLAPEAEERLRQDIRQLVPIGRLGTPWELAQAAVYLASDESRFMLGSELLVDGGVANL
jgi:NAD(P)-dependent dehydrogenase (short-subunit alcohol dehydrogenase family)